MVLSPKWEFGVVSTDWTCWFFEIKNKIVIKKNCHLKKWLFLSLCIPLLKKKKITIQIAVWCLILYHISSNSSGNYFAIFFFYSSTVPLPFKHCGSSTWARTYWVFTSTEDSIQTFLLRNKPLQPLYVRSWLNLYDGGSSELAQTPWNNSHHCIRIGQRELEAGLLASSAETKTQNCAQFLFYL